MSDKPEALQLADWFEGGYGGCELEAAAELRRLHEAHEWQYKMAGDRLRRIEKLETVNQELLEALKYHQEQTRPIERTRAAIAKAEGQA